MREEVREKEDEGLREGRRKEGRRREGRMTGRRGGI